MFPTILVSSPFLGGAWAEVFWMVSKGSGILPSLGAPHNGGFLGGFQGFWYPTLLGERSNESF